MYASYFSKANTKDRSVYINTDFLNNICLIKIKVDPEKNN